MQQRRLRLGDILDDYCPRERRITNHAVVAMIEDAVKQTRCTTCDADHEYKHARVPAPRRRKPDALSGEIEGTLRRRPVAAEEEGESDVSEELEQDQDQELEPAEMLADDDAQALDADADADLDGEAEDDDGQRGVDEGPVHRRLIRATLPRQAGQTPERKEPEFTVRQPGSGGRSGREFDGNKGGFRPGGSGGAAGGQGRRPMRAQGGASSGQPSRFGGGPRQSSGQGGQGPRHGSGQGPGQGPRQQGNRPGQPGANRGGGRPPGQGGRGPGAGGGGGRKRGR